MAPELSIIIPAYNEALRIGATLNDVITYLDDHTYTYEIIVVDDGSRDSTSTVATKFPQVRLLKNPENRGKGYSVKRGMLEAKGKLRLFMDADHSVHINNLPNFIREIGKGAQIVIASIELPNATIEDDNHGYRRVFGRWAKWLIRNMITPGIYDTQRGFKLFTQEAARAVFPQQKIDRWGFDFEILSKAQKKGILVKEMAVVWTNSRASSVSIWSYFHTLYDLVKIKICA